MYTYKSKIGRRCEIQDKTIHMKVSSNNNHPDKNKPFGNGSCAENIVALMSMHNTFMWFVMCVAGGERVQEIAHFFFFLSFTSLTHYAFVIDYHGTNSPLFSILLIARQTLSSSVQSEVCACVYMDVQCFAQPFAQRFAYHITCALISF